MNVMSKLGLLAVPAALALSASSAFAKAELLADLHCEGKTSDGEKVQFHVDGVYSRVQIKGQTLAFKSVEKDGKTTEVKAEQKFKMYLSKNYKHFEMKMNDSETLKGRCVDSLKGVDDQADDTEQPDLPQIIGD